MKDLIIFNHSLRNVSMYFNHSVFIDRVHACLCTDGINLNYGVFLSKVHASGLIRVLKSLGLYKVIGKGNTKKVFIHPKIELISKTTIACNKIVAQTIIDLVDKRSLIPTMVIDYYSNYDSLEESKIKRDGINCSTYVIYSPEQRNYKIGRSKNIMKRLQSLRRQFTPNLELIIHYPKDIEADLHFEYRDKRVYGEWFNISIDDVLDMKNKYNMTSSK